MVLSAGLILSSLLALGASAGVVGETFSVKETKTGAVGIMSVSATSEIYEKYGVASTFGDQPNCYKNIKATYRYENYVSGKQTTLTKSATETQGKTASVFFSAPSGSVYQSCYLSANLTVVSSGTLILSTEVQKR